MNAHRRLAEDCRKQKRLSPFEISVAWQRKACAPGNKSDLLDVDSTENVCKEKIVKKALLVLPDVLITSIGIFGFLGCKRKPIRNGLNTKLPADYLK
jgi:hypothetical protein